MLLTFSLVPKCPPFKMLMVNSEPKIHSTALGSKSGWLLLSAGLGESSTMRREKAAEVASDKLLSLLAAEVTERTKNLPPAPNSIHRPNAVQGKAAELYYLKVSTPFPIHFISSIKHITEAAHFPLYPHFSLRCIVLNCKSVYRDCHWGALRGNPFNPRHLNMFLVYSSAWLGFTAALNFIICFYCNFIIAETFTLSN